MRGPDLVGLQAQLEALVASLRYDPPFVPLATGPDAATDAATKALAVLGSSDPAWLCFPPTVSRQTVVSSLPMGPDLVGPQLATCATSIVATPIQAWRMDLAITLPSADPLAGHGQTYVVWVQSDGTPGAEAGGSPIP